MLYLPLGHYQHAVSTPGSVISMLYLPLGQLSACCIYPWVVISMLYLPLGQLSACCIYPWVSYQHAVSTPGSVISMLYLPLGQLSACCIYPWVSYQHAVSTLHQLVSWDMTNLTCAQWWLHMSVCIYWNGTKASLIIPITMPNWSLWKWKHKHTKMGSHDTYTFKTG